MSLRSWARHAGAQFLILGLGMAQAVAQPVAFDIPSSTLPAAILEFARQASVQIVAPADDLNRTVTPAVKGSYEKLAALQLLLSGTDLSVASDDGATIALERRSAESRLAGNGRLRLSQAPAIAVTAPASTGASIALLELEEVIVTSQKREENLQHAAASIAALNGDELRRQGKTNLMQILKGVAGVETGAGGYFWVRGIGSGAQFGQDSSVTLTSNGVFVQRAQTPRDVFYDVARVEVARGPQTTLTGRTSEGGAISVISNEPALDRVEIKGTIEAGDHGLLSGQGVVNAPINDMLAVRGAFSASKRRGYLTGGGNDVDSVSARARLLIQPTDAIKLILSAERNTSVVSGITMNSANTGYFNLAGPFTLTNGYYWNPSPQTSYNRYEITNLYADFNWNLGWATLFFQPTYQSNATRGDSYTTNYATYSTALASGFTDATAYSRATMLVRTASPQLQRSYELRLTSPAESRIKWLVGAYYYWQEQILASQAANGGSTGTPNSAAIGIWPVAPEPTLYPQSNRRVAEDHDVYAQATYPVTDAWRVTAGARYSSDAKVRAFAPGNYLLPNGTFINTNSRFPLNDGVAGVANGTSFVYYNISATDVTYKRTNWLAKLEHDFTPTSMAYGMVSTGWKTGSFLSIPQASEICPTTPTITGSVGCAAAVPYITPGFKAAYDPEYLTAYEIGSKNTLLNGRLRLNVSAYYYDYNGYQFSYGVNYFNPATGVDPDFAPVGAYTGNGTASSYGGEFESSYLLGVSDRIDLNVSNINAKLKSLAIASNATASVQAWAAQMAGFQLPHSPKWQVMPKYAHVFALGSGGRITAAIDAQYSSTQVIGLPSNTAQIPKSDYWTQRAYTKGNLSLSYDSPGSKWVLTGYVNNFTNKNTIIDANLPQTFSSFGQMTFSPDDPRTYGVMLSGSL
jgi:iron complex outermembrane receptor protein